MQGYIYNCACFYQYCSLYSCFSCSIRVLEAIYICIFLILFGMRPLYPQDQSQRDTTLNQHQTPLKKHSVL